tara:strand:+ start:2057 stop:2287 length:231 start_codon:yes stop_codon:yes gene_type:complete
MKRKKPTNKDFENAIIHLKYDVNNLTGYINGIAEVLNGYIEFGGNSKKFFKTLEQKVEHQRKEDKKDIPDIDKSSK